MVVLMESPERKRARFTVTGNVQGVGFRPFVYRVAAREGLGGFVWNDSRGVTIEVEGRGEAIERFAAALSDELPPLAKILTLNREEVEPVGEAEFRIERSRSLDSRSALVTPDSATCADCLAEMRDGADRRHRYPFINCTNCGPRYTIIEDVPYDRPKTTMKVFPMCAECQAEYDNPLSRRFHAQPNACPVCGPRLVLADADGSPVEASDVVRHVIDALAAGKIAAIKGLGGFHLACDAGNDAAVRRLRERKHREEKAFAIMVRDIEAARRIVKVTKAAERALTSVQRPIVLLEKRTASPISGAVAPRSRFHGVMLAYTPLHHLLLDAGYQALVMTSANVTDEPIVKDNDEAIERLGGIADIFVLHNRDIRVRVDDSVVRVVGGKVYPVRRSRGWAPGPVILKRKSPVEILAVGGELKNTVTLVKNERAYVSQHIGDLKNALAFDNFKESVGALSRLMEVTPELIACDMHPQYLSARHARAMGLPVVEVQHHHAHIASVMAEHGRRGRVIGIAADGTGYGEDGAVWGCEILDASPADYLRLGHLKYVRLPGGDAATRETDRAAYSHLLSAYGSEEAFAWTGVYERLGEKKRALLRRMIEGGVKSPWTSSLGRLFDAASAIAGVCRRAVYEAQGPIEFEALATAGEADAYPWEIVQSGDGFIIDPGSIIRAVAEETAAGTALGVVSARFHNSVADFLAEAAVCAREMTGLGVVALSGGVFQNEYLLKAVMRRLRAARFRVLIHRETPPNDGCISLGQAAVAAERARLGMIERK
jgi:hydrogenase maturation protein HypF